MLDEIRTSSDAAAAAASSTARLPLPVRIHDFPFAPNPRRVRVFMAEKGIELPHVNIDLMQGEHRSAEFLKLNPLGQLPVLELDDGTYLTESVAICRYLEELHPEPPLFGGNAISRARIEMWNRRVEIEVFGTIGSIALHTSPMFKDRISQFPAFADKQREFVPVKWAWLDREMADGRPFVAGSKLSVADITASVASWLGEFLEAPIPEQLANVRAWDSRMRARPSWNA